MTPRAWLIFLPALVLSAALGAICFHFHTVWPFPLILHEDGRHTLWGTIFYFEHATQELPVDLLLAAGIAGAVLYQGGVARQRLPVRLLLAALALDVAILIGACRQVGSATAVQWLLQSHTRDGVPLAIGSHWGYHLLSEAALLLLGMALAALGSSGRSGAGLLTATWIVFGALSLVLIRTSAPFADPRYLGHQMRETLTHSLVTVPLAVAVCWGVTGTGFVWKPLSSGALWPAVGFIVLSVYLAAGAVVAGSGHQAQTNDPIKLLCSHFFEHTLGYLVVALHAPLFLVLASRRTQ